ncbi:hypothetical protein D3C72_1603980 [compost metagenome]
MLVGASLDATVGTVIKWQCEDLATALPASSDLPPPTAITMSAPTADACARRPAMTSGVRSPSTIKGASATPCAAHKASILGPSTPWT